MSTSIYWQEAASIFYGTSAATSKWHEPTGARIGFDTAENEPLKVWRSFEIKVNPKIDRVVNNTNNELVLKLKFEEAKTLGIIKKMINGFLTPPVK